MKLLTTWGAALFASAFSFLSNLMMARLLSLSDYAAYINFLGIMSILSMLQPGIQSITARQVSLHMATKGRNYAQLSLKKIWWLGVALAFLGGILLLLSMPWLAAITLSELDFIIFLPLCFSFSLLFSISMGGLQGLQRIRSIAFTTAISAFLRLPVSWLLVIFGLKLYGAILALPIVAGISAIIASALGVFSRVSSSILPTDISILSYLTQRQKYYDFKNTFLRAIQTSFLPILTHISFLVLTSIDIIFVKRFLETDLQSYYALIATLGKIALYTTQPIAILLLPRATALVGQGKNAFTSLQRSLGLTMCLGLSTCIVLLFGSSWITGLFMPSFPLTLQPFIPLYAAAMSLMGIIYILNTYCIALNIPKLAFLQTIIVLIMTGVFFTQSLSIANAISLMLIASALLCTSGFIICYYLNPPSGENKLT